MNSKSHLIDENEFWSRQAKNSTHIFFYIKSLRKIGILNPVMAHFEVNKLYRQIKDLSHKLVFTSIR
jgi:hypothetical protein